VPTVIGGLKDLNAARTLLSNDAVTHHEAQLTYRDMRKRYAAALGRFSALVVGGRR